MKQPIRRLTALLLALSMTLTLAGMASAAEVDSAELPAETSVTEENWDALPVQEAEEVPPEAVSADGEEADVPTEDGETSAEGEELPQEALPEEAQSEEEPQSPQTFEDTGADASDDGAVADPPQDDAPVDDAPVTQTPGWSCAPAEDGTWDFSFYYTSDGAIVAAAGGYYRLPEGKVTVSVPNESGAAQEMVYTFAAGIYAFDEDGVCQQTRSNHLVSVALTPISASGDSFAAGKTDEFLLKLGSVKITEDGQGGRTVSSPIALYSGKHGGRYYYQGELYSGLFRNNEKGCLYLMKNGDFTRFTGVMDKSYKHYICNYKELSTRDGRYYLKGVVLTGFDKNTLRYYKKGKVDPSYTSWKTKGGHIYYFKKGKALTGEQRIKRNGNTYQYTFRPDGTLVTNLFQYNSSYKKKKLLVSISRKTHTATILAYNNKTKEYDIPVKSFVVSMSKKAGGTRPGTYRLTQRKRWWRYASKIYYQYATYVSGSGSWVHSEMYASANIHALKPGTYNALGTNQSKQCIRMQVVNCKLLYDLSKSNKDVKVSLNYSSHNIPFGKMTLNYNFDHKGKISSHTDPTDPAA